MEVHFINRVSFRQAIYAVIVAFLLGSILSFFQISSDYLKERKRIDDDVQQILLMIKDPATEAAYLIDGALADKVINGLFEYESISEVKIIDDFGTVLGHKRRTAPSFSSEPKGLVNAFRNQSSSYTEPLYHEASDKTVGLLIVNVDKNLIAKNFFQRSRLIIISDLIRNIILVLILALIFQITLTRPLLRIIRQVSTVSIRKPAKMKIQTPKGHTRNEIGLLVNTLNYLLSSFEKSLQQRKSAKQQIQESETKYQRIFDNIQDVYFEARCDGEILEVSPSVQDLFKYKREAIIGKPLIDLCRQAQKCEEFLLTISQKKNISNFEMHLKDGEGYEHLAFINARIVDDRISGLSKIVGLIRDMTKQKELEEQLQHSQKLEAIGRLAGGVAHDFNNLLTAIMGYSDLLLSDLEFEESNKMSILEIMKSAKKAASLTQKLLAYSRKQVLQPRVIDINALIAELDKMLHRLIGEDIKLATELGSELGMVKVDPGQIEQVIVNLAVNARDAMPLGGKLTIMTKNTFLDENYCKRYPGVIPGEHILLDVTDTGNGMDKETRNHIFEPFFTTKETGKGTGLGLSTVYGIIKQSNGHITVQSKPGHGTTFKIYFPVESDGLGDMKKITDIQKPTGGSETVLLVEDEDIVRQMVSTILKNFGYSVMEASNGREAIRICKRHLNNGFHLLITDVIMPGMNGRELAEKLKADFTIMKVLYISGYTDDAIVTREVLDEEFPFLQKPFTPNALAKKVREILDGQSAKL